MGSPKNKTSYNYGLLLPVGLGIGIAIGAAILNIGAGLAIGAGIGTIFSLLAYLIEQHRESMG